WGAWRARTTRAPSRASATASARRGETSAISSHASSSAPRSATCASAAVCRTRHQAIPLLQPRSSPGLSRPPLLLALGRGAAASPFIPLLNADAQTAPRPKRLLLLFTPDGSPALNFSSAVDWRPTGTETAFTLQSMYAALEPFKSKIVVPGGLTLSVG